MSGWVDPGAMFIVGSNLGSLAGIAVTFKAMKDDLENQCDVDVEIIDRTVQDLHSSAI